MRVRFDDFLYDGDRRELKRGETPLRLSPKALQLLESLIQQAPAAVSKDDLYRSLWGEGFVEEANLANLVSELRAVLGDSRQEGRFISTLHGFGYRFDGELLEAVRGLPGPARSSRYRIVWGDRPFPLAEGENTLGRSEEARVRIDLAGVSRLHALITVSEETASLEDLGSKNGTFLGDRRVDAPTPLRDGDLLRLGSVSLAFRAHRGSETTMTEHVEDLDLR